MTQKIVQTTEHRLSVARTIIKHQEEEIQKLRLRLSQHQRDTKTKKQPAATKCTPPLQERFSSGNSDDRTQTGKDSRSYARSTRASRIRESTTSPMSSEASTAATSDSSSSSRSDVTKHAPHRVTFAGTAYAYKKGKLGPVGSNYLRSTKAIVNKFGDHEQRREKKCGVFRPPPVNRDWWIPTPDPYAVSTVGPDEGVQPQQPVQIPQRPVDVVLQEVLDDETERERLEIQTRLHDNAWLSDTSNNVWLDHNKTYEILFTAERLAKECFREWRRINRPEKRISYLSDVDFGRCSLTSFMNTETSAFRATQPHQFRMALEDMISLRNFVHHFSGWSCPLKSADYHLANVQRLAVRLYDEERAHAARGLRDRLRREAEEVAREIEALALLTALPFSEEYPWKPHHITLFRGINLIDEESQKAARERFSTAVVEGALDFAKRGSDMSWDSEPAVEASLAKILSLDSGSHGSTQ